MTALASYLAARSVGGRWLLRIDDLDAHRLDPAAESTIMRQLETHGLFWDESPRRQSEHVDEYRSALSLLRASNRIYACNCTRAELARHSLAGPDASVYNGRCRYLRHSETGNALRIEVPARDMQLCDLARGLETRRLREDVGDFVLQRRDGVIAYQLACAVDEQAQGITDVVRGADLLGSTFMQVHLMKQLGLRLPQYLHLAVLTDSMKRKFSKQNHSLAVRDQDASTSLVRCLELLGQRPPPGLIPMPPPGILSWAIPHWKTDKLARNRHIELDTL